MNKAGVFFLVILNGCAFMPVHNIQVSPELRENPIMMVALAKPQFAEKIKRWSGSIERPESLIEMLPTNQAESAKKIANYLQIKLTNRGLTVFNFNEEDRFIHEWAQNISQDLAKERVPLKVSPLLKFTPPKAATIAPILLTGIVWYGHEDIHPMIRILWFKPWNIGKPRWLAVCQLHAILVDPITGKVLLSVEYKEAIRTSGPNSALLEEVTKKTVQLIADTFPTRSY